MTDFRFGLEQLCRGLRETGSGYVYADAISDYLDHHPASVDDLVELFDEETNESTKELLGSLLLDRRAHVPAIEYLRDVCRYPREDMEEYPGYLQWLRETQAKE